MREATEVKNTTTAFVQRFGSTEGRLVRVEVLETDLEWYERSHRGQELLRGLSVLLELLLYCFIQGSRYYEILVTLVIDR